MAERGENIVKPSLLAKELDVHLGTIYGLVKRGVVKSYREEGDDSEMVDRNEVKLALATGRKRGGGARKSGQGGSLRREAGPRARKGDIVSYEKHPVHSTRLGERAIVQVGATRRLPAGEGIVRLYSSPERYTEWQASSLSQRMAQGLAKVEGIATLLSMILVQMVRDDKIDEAASLETWMDEHDYEVLIPDLDAREQTDEELAEAGVEDEPEVLAGEDDEDLPDE